MKLQLTPIARMTCRSAQGAAILLALSPAAHTQSHEPNSRGEKTSSSLAQSYEFEGGKNSIEVPFTMVSGAIILPIDVRGERFAVALDTGMPMPGMLLTRTAAVDALGIKPDWSEQIGGGSGDRVAIAWARDEEIVIGDLTLKSLDVGLREPEAGTALGVGDGGIAGIIGYSLFESFVVHVDFDRMIMTLSEPGVTAPPADERTVPLAIRRNDPYLPLEVTMPDGASAEIEVVLDLGNTAGMVLNLDGVEGLSAPEGGASTIGTGFKSAIHGTKGQISGLRVGPFTLPGREVSFMSNRIVTAGSAGNIGIPELRQFNLNIDYTNGRMVLEPNSAHHTGAIIEARDGGLFVKRLLLKSLAEAAGLSVGEQIMQVDGESVSELGPAGALALLRRPGETVWLETDLAGLQRITEIHLR